MIDMQLIPFFAAGIAFLSVLLAGYGIMGYLGGTNDSARLKERISGSAGNRSGSFSEPLSSMTKGFLGLFGRIGDKLGPKKSGEIDKTRMRLVQAGLRNPDSYRTFQGIKGGLALLLTVPFLAVRFLILPELPLYGVAFGAVLLATIGIYGPEVWLTKKIKNRKKAAGNELPDALDLLVVCVESGMGLDQAIDRVCEEMRTSGPVISSEFKLLTLELRAGKARNEALRSLAGRVGLEDLNSLTSLLIQADTFGISVGRTLRVYSDTMRVKRSQRAEEKAAKMPVLLLLPLACFILPALFITIIGPAVILFIDTFSMFDF